MFYDVSPLDGHSPEIGLLLSALDDSTREWRENLEEPTVEAITWRAGEDMYSIGILILHLIDAEDYWFRVIAGGLERDPAETALFMSQELDQYGGRWPIAPAQPISWYYEMQDRFRARAIEAIKGLDPAKQFTRPSGNTFTLRWIVAHVLEHDSYTGGQAVAVHELWRRQQRDA